MLILPRQFLTVTLCLALAGSPLPVLSQTDHTDHSDSQQASHQGGSMMQHGDGQSGGMMQHGGGDGQGGGMMRRMMRGMGDSQQAAATSGQSVMDVIAEVIQTLQANPDTDWSRINIDALRQHLVDMDRVALYAEAQASDVEAGSLFRITGPDPRTVAAIQRMVPNHAQQIERELGWDVATETTADGVNLRVVADDGQAEMIRAIGFVGFMTLGEHHADHHLMMAGGQPGSGSHGGNGQSGGMMQHGGGGGQGGGMMQHGNGQEGDNQQDHRSHQGSDR